MVFLPVTARRVPALKRCEKRLTGSAVNEYLVNMGYTLTEDSSEADFVIFNTCAVRGGAEERVLGNVGALKHKKEHNPEMIIGIMG